MHNLFKFVSVKKTRTNTVTSSSNSHCTHDRAHEFKKPATKAREGRFVFSKFHLKWREFLTEKSIGKIYRLWTHSRCFLEEETENDK